MDSLHDSIEEFTEAIPKMFEPIALAFQELGKSLCKALGIVIPEEWERYADESLLAWGKRLERMGVLDNPDIRWVYQKAMLLWLVSPITWIWRKIT